MFIVSPPTECKLYAKHKKMFEAIGHVKIAACGDLVDHSSQNVLLRNMLLNIGTANGLLTSPPTIYIGQDLGRFLINDIGMSSKKRERGVHVLAYLD